MVEGTCFVAEQDGVTIQRRPTPDSETLLVLEKGDEITASELLLKEGVQWVKLDPGSSAWRSSTGQQVLLNLAEEAYVATALAGLGTLLRRKHAQSVVAQQEEEGVLSKADIEEVLQMSPDPSLLLPLESKHWTKEQLVMYVMSGGASRPKNCSLPNEQLLANIKMTQEDIVHAFAEAINWILSADAILIGSGAGMGVDSGLGTFRGGKKGVWIGLDAVGLAYEDICQPKWFNDEPHLAWGFWNYCHQAYQASRPHEGYQTLRRLAKRCPLGFFSFTSNIDSHWTASGMSSDRVLEVHGAVRWLQCSKLCCPDVWKASNDLGLTEDEQTHRVHGVLPTCPKCKAVARPNVQMFGGDSSFSGARRASQKAKYDAWLKSMSERPDRDSLRIVCIEVGCGLTVPTVRKEMEKTVREFPGARLVRINPENPGLAPELSANRKGVSLPLPASMAIEELGKHVSKALEEAQLATFLLWGEDGSGCEIRAPQTASLGRLLRIAESQTKTKVQFSMGAKGVASIPMSDRKEVLGLESSAPYGFTIDVKFAEGSRIEPTVVIEVQAKFGLPGAMNSELARRKEQVSALLDEMNELFADSGYQSRVRSCGDRQELLKEIKAVQFGVLPKYGIEASEKGTMVMATWISVVQHLEGLQKKVDYSMEMSGVKNLGKLPASSTGLAAPMSSPKRIASKA